MRSPNWFHRIGLVVWALLVVAAIVVRPGWGYDALQLVPLVFLLAIGAAVLVSQGLRRR